MDIRTVLLPQDLASPPVGWCFYGFWADQKLMPGCERDTQASRWGIFRCIGRETAMFPLILLRACWYCRLCVLGSSGIVFSHRALHVATVFVNVRLKLESPKAHFGCNCDQALCRRKSIGPACQHLVGVWLPQHSLHTERNIGPLDVGHSAISHVNVPQSKRMFRRPPA